MNQHSTLFSPNSQTFPFSLLVFHFCLGLSFMFTPLTLQAGPSSLVKAQNIKLDVVALTERGRQDPTTLHDTLKRRLEEVGYVIVTEPTQAYDVVVRLKCEERKRWSGPSKYRVGTHSRVEASRLWKGPACQISYRHKNSPPTWSWEIHTPFEEARPAAQKAGVKKVGLFALQALNSQLQKDPFPLHLAAEWGQVSRLVTILHKNSQNQDIQKLVLALLGPLPDPQAFSTLQESLNDPVLGKNAISAMGYQGEVAIPTLAAVLKDSTNEEQRLAAIKSLGEIATHSKAPALFDQFLPLLHEENPRIQTIAVKSLGRLGDQRAIAPLEELNLKTWTNTSTDPDIKELREALNWSLWQLNPDAHTGE